MESQPTHLTSYSVSKHHSDLHIVFIVCLYFFPGGKKNTLKKQKIKKTRNGIMCHIQSKSAQIIWDFNIHSSIKINYAGRCSIHSNFIQTPNNVLIGSLAHRFIYAGVSQQGASPDCTPWTLSRKRLSVFVFGFLVSGLEGANLIDFQLQVFPHWKVVVP